MPNKLLVRVHKHTPYESVTNVSYTFYCLHYVIREQAKYCTVKDDCYLGSSNNLVTGRGNKAIVVRMSILRVVDFDIFYNTITTI